MPENSAEMFDRVRLMARIDTDWDLSDNDTAALRHVLAATAAHAQAKRHRRRSRAHTTSSPSPRRLPTCSARSSSPSRRMISKLANPAAHAVG